MWEKRRKSPQASRRAQPCQYLDFNPIDPFQISDFWNSKSINLCFFKPLNLEQSVTTVLGNKLPKENDPKHLPKYVWNLCYRNEAGKTSLVTELQMCWRQEEVRKSAHGVYHWLCSQPSPLGGAVGCCKVIIEITVFNKTTPKKHAIESCQQGVTQKGMETCLLCAPAVEWLQKSVKPQKACRMSGSDQGHGVQGLWRHKWQSPEDMVIYIVDIPGDLTKDTNTQ